MKKTLWKIACGAGIVGVLAIGGGNVDKCWAITYSELYDFAVEHADEDHGMYTLAGLSIEWWPASATTTEVFYDGNFLGTFDDDDVVGMTNAIADYLGVPVTDLLLGTQSASGSGTKTASVVFQNIIMPPVQTKKAAEQADAQKSLNTPRTFGAAIRYEKIDPDTFTDGDLYGLNVGMAWDQENYTVGFMLPYEHLEFDDFFDADRLGLIGFGQCQHEIKDNVVATYSVFLDYMNTAIDYDSASNDDINTYGGGVGAAVTFDRDSYVIGVGGSYQYHKDDSNIADDEQHLVKIGANTGLRINDNKVVNIFANWTWDVTDYDVDLQDDDYFEVGAELQADFSDTWALSVGAKQIVDLQSLDSYQIYLGSTWRFM